MFPVYLKTFDFKKLKQDFLVKAQIKKKKLDIYNFSITLNYSIVSSINECESSMH